MSEGAPQQLVLIFEAPAIPAWLEHFSQRAAVEAMYAYVATLPSSRNPERHTLKVYSEGLKHFLNWIGDDLPTLLLMQQYVAMHVQRGVTSRTIISRYLVPTKHYLKALANQHIEGLTGATRDLVTDCREQIRQAIQVPYPRSEVSSDVSPLWRAEFKRLTIDQVNELLRSIDRTTLTGLRDYALFRLAFSTGLRLAELARVSCDAICPLSDQIYTVSVRGKRNTIDPVPMDANCYQDLMTYVEAFNAALPADDPQQVKGNAPIWKALNRYGRPLVMRGREACKGLSHQAIRDIIGGRSAAALGEAWKLAVHDTRRTCAFMAYEAGMALDDIRALLRHKDISTTMKYIGQRPDMSKRMLGRLLSFG